MDIWGVHTKNTLPMDALLKYFADLWLTKMAGSRDIVENIKSPQMICILFGCLFLFSDLFWIQMSIKFLQYKQSKKNNNKYHTEDRT